MTSLAAKLIFTLQKRITRYAWQWVRVLRSEVRICPLAYGQRFGGKQRMPVTKPEERARSDAVVRTKALIRHDQNSFRARVMSLDPKSHERRDCYYRFGARKVR